MNPACKILPLTSRLSRFSGSRLASGKFSIRPATRHNSSFSKISQASLSARNCCLVAANRQYSSEGDLRKLPNAEWLKRLTPEQFYICREKGTEEPFSGEYCSHYEEGLYTCVCCGAALFSSKAKFEANTGWPTFSSSYGDGEDDDKNIEVNVLKRADNALGTSRMETICKKCHAHLGHVFPDGPKPSGERYCINSIALAFKSTKMD